MSQMSKKSLERLPEESLRKGEKAQLKPTKGVMYHEMSFFFIHEKTNGKFLPKEVKTHVKSGYCYR